MELGPPCIGEPPYYRRGELPYYRREPPYYRRGEPPYDVVQRRTEGEEERRGEERRGELDRRNLATPTPEGGELTRHFLANSAKRPRIYIETLYETNFPQDVCRKASKSGGYDFRENAFGKLLR